jgi:hypothetical protein
LSPEVKNENIAACYAVLSNKLAVAVNSAASWYLTNERKKEIFL